MARIVLLPFFASTLIYGYYFYSLLLFIISALTDLLDGYLARVSNQTTKIGSILDPLADKFLLVISFIIMSKHGWIPVWLTITVISRDLVIVTGWLILSYVSVMPTVNPTKTGKIAVFSQFILIGLILTLINLDYKSSIPFPILIVVAMLTSFSGIQYIYRGLKIANIS